VREREVIRRLAFSALPLTADPQQLRCWPSSCDGGAAAREFVDLKSGDWVVARKAANFRVSGDGWIAFAKARGLKPSISSRRPELVRELETSAETSLVVDSPDVAQHVKDAVRSG